MISVPQVVCCLACGLMLCLGLSPVAEAHNKVVTACALKAGPFAQRHGWQVPTVEQLNNIAHGGQSKGGLTIKDDVLHVEGTHDFVRVPESKEGRLRIDGTTPRAGKVELGNRIEARLKGQDYAYSIPSDQRFCMGNS
jgi:hypothetical protein